MHRTTLRELKVTSQLATPGAESAVYDCLVLLQPCTYTHPFKGSFSGTTQVSWYQKGKTNLDFTEARE